MKFKTPFEYWMDDNEDEFRGMWESMGRVERFEEGPEFSDFCRARFEEDKCQDCGHYGGSGACFTCKVD